MNFKAILKPGADFFRAHVGFSYFLLFIFAILILFLRRTDAFLNPQFWAEDGKIFYSEAYHLGLETLLWLRAGYFIIFAKIIALISQLLPLAWAPLFFNLAAATIQALPFLFIISKRFQHLIPSVYFRFFLGLVILLIPNSAETHLNLNNSQSYLALLACMVLLVSESAKRAWKIFDLSVLATSGLSGPFCLFYAPVAFWQWYNKKTSWRLKLFIVSLFCAVMQAYSLFILTPRLMLAEIPKMSPDLFLGIIYKQIFLGAIFGNRGYAALQNIFLFPPIFLTVMVMGLTVVIFAFVKARLELKLFMMFAFFIFCSSMLAPTTLDVPNSWAAMFNSDGGARNWLIPIIAFLVALFWSVKVSNPAVIRVIAVVFLSFMLVGVSLDFFYPHYHDFEFQKYARKFQDIPAGTRLEIPINPPGWNMTLIKE